MYVVFLRSQDDEEVNILAVFLMETPAREFRDAQQRLFVSELKIKELPVKAWEHFFKLKDYLYPHSGN